MANTFELRSRVDETRRTTHLVALADGRVAARFVDQSGRTQTREWEYSADLSAGEVSKGFFDPLSSPVVKGSTGDWEWSFTVWYDGLTAPAAILHDRDAAYPHYLLWPAGETQAPLTGAVLHEDILDDADYGSDYLVAARNAAREFEQTFNPRWAALASQGLLTDTVGTDTLDVQETQRQQNTEEWGRGHVGLLAAMLHYLRNGYADEFPGLQEPLTRAAVDAQADRVYQDIHEGRIRDWYANHPIDTWWGALNQYQLRPTSEYWHPEPPVYIAPNHEWWDSLKSRWFWAALFSKYPAVADLRLSAKPQDGVAVSLQGDVDVVAGGEPTYRWDTSPDRTTWTTIADADKSAYTPENDQVGLYLRCVVHYTRDGYNLVGITNADTVA